MAGHNSSSIFAGEIGWQTRTAQSHVLHLTGYLGVNTQPVLSLPGSASTLSFTENTLPW